MGPAKQQLRPRSGCPSRKLNQLSLRLSAIEAKGGDLAWRSRIGAIAAERGFHLTGWSSPAGFVPVRTELCRESGGAFCFIANTALSILR